MDAVLRDLDINVMASPKAIQVGSVIKQRFVLEEVIGEGGMGTIYKARDLRREEANADQVHVAIKIVNDKLKQHPQAFSALQHEANKAQALNNDHIVQIYDFDRDGDTAYITMEYLQGRTLDKLMKNFAIHGLSYPQKLALMLTVAKALAYAHEHNCVHGDLKPSNIFITNDNRVKIIDFGLANASTESEAPKSAVKAVMHAYTPAYASQELLAGHRPNIADDVYAFACLAYEFLGGSHPYQKMSALAAAEQKRQPKPIQYMPKIQWRALRKGLQVTATKRKVSMRGLIAAFSEGKSMPKWVWWTLGVVAIVIMAYVANQLDPII
jgi:serine/threonine protein kinase